MAVTPENVTDTIGMIQWISDTATVGGINILFPGIIVLIFIIMSVKMLSNQNNTASKTFASASFVCMILSVFARLLGVVSTAFMSFWIAAMALTAMWMYMENR